MLTIEKWVGPSPEQWEMIIEGMRNPKNSWHLIDSDIRYVEDLETLDSVPFEFFMGEKDHDLAMRLAKGGPVHGKYRRMIPIWVDIVAPLYWWKEFDTYKVGTVANSCSTMHKIHAKEFTLDDFSTDHLEDFSWNRLDDLIGHMNICRKKFLETKDKTYWWQMIQLLPSSYNQKRTVMLNYEVLHNIYYSRKGHKLDEWKVICDWIESLPYADLILAKDMEVVHD